MGKVYSLSAACLILSSCPSKADLFPKYWGLPAGMSKVG